MRHIRPLCQLTSPLHSQGAALAKTNIFTSNRNKNQPTKKKNRYTSAHTQHTPGLIPPRFRTRLHLELLTAGLGRSDPDQVGSLGLG